MTNGQEKSEIGQEVKKEIDEKKEIVSKVDFSEDGSSVSIYISLNPKYINTAIFTLEKLKFDLLTMVQEQRKQQILAKQRERDILQARDPMATNAKKDKNFFKKHFMH